VHLAAAGAVKCMQEWSRFSFQSSETRPGGRTLVESVEKRKVVAGGKAGGEGGIRTPGRVTPTSDFESGAFNHSATSPSFRILGLAVSGKRWRAVVSRKL
jgi:hypothetical protein